MKVLFVYNSLEPQSVAGAAVAKLHPSYPDCTLKDIKAIETADISTWIGTLSAVYSLILINYTVTTAGTGVLSPAQVILLDAKCARTVLKTGTATAASSTNTLTASAMGAVVNAYAGMYVKTTGGTGLNQVLQIVSNSATVLTLASAWPVAISTDTTFAICATRDEFSHTIAATSGNLKRALTAWQHEKMFYGTPEPLIIYKLAGDKTTADTVTNAQDVLDESYIVKAAKFFGRNLADPVVLRNWNKLLFNELIPSTTTLRQPPFNQALYNDWMEKGKLLVESATALSVTL